MKKDAVLVIALLIVIKVDCYYYSNWWPGTRYSCCYPENGYVQPPQAPETWYQPQEPCCQTTYYQPKPLPQPEPQPASPCYSNNCCQYSYNPNYYSECCNTHNDCEYLSPYRWLREGDKCSRGGGAGRCGGLLRCHDGTCRGLTINIYRAPVQNVTSTTMKSETNSTKP